MELRSDSEDATFKSLNGETSADSSSSDEGDIIFEKPRRSQRVSFAPDRLTYGLLRNNLHDEPPAHNDSREFSKDRDRRDFTVEPGIFTVTDKKMIEANGIILGTSGRQR